MTSEFQEVIQFKFNRVKLIISAAKANLEETGEYVRALNASASQLELDESDMACTNGCGALNTDKLLAKMDAALAEDGARRAAEAAAVEAELVAK